MVLKLDVVKMALAPGVTLSFHAPKDGRQGAS